MDHKNDASYCVIFRIDKNTNFLKNSFDAGISFELRRAKN